MNAARQKQIHEAFGAGKNTYYSPVSMDVQHGQLWDSVRVDHGTRFDKFDLFSVPLGHENKTHSDTNMLKSQQLCAPEAFSIQRVLFTFSRSTLDEDLYAIAENTLWRLWIGQKTYLWGTIISLPTVAQPVSPLRVCDFCASVYVGDPCPSCGARQFTLSSHGEVENGGRQFFLDASINVVIDCQASFHVTMECQPSITLRHAHAGGCGVRLWCHLEGLHSRGAQ